MKDAAVEDVALSAARVLAKFGMETPDWDEWRTLKNDLLRLHPFLRGHTREVVGAICSEFNQELAKFTS